jgi:hypothetical protein
VNSIKTVGLAKKVPWQAGTTLIVAALAYYGVDLDPEVSAALGVVAGFIGGWFAPAAVAVPVPSTNPEAGYTLIELVVGALLFLVFLAFCVWVLRALL